MVFASRFRKAIPFWAASAETAWKKYGMYNWSLSDPLMRAFFFNRFESFWYAYAPFYNHWFISMFAVGASMAATARQIFFNPEYSLRRAEGRRLPTDRMEIYYFSLPYFNHHLRHFSACFRNSLVDNEPDYLNHHPWGIRPDVRNSPKRVKLLWALPWYFVDCEHYEASLHTSIQKKLEESGYCKPLYPTIGAAEE